MADSDPEMPAIEYRIRPTDAATSTMQMAIKIVEIRIICRATLPAPPILTPMLIRDASDSLARLEPGLSRFPQRRPLARIASQSDLSPHPPSPEGGFRRIRAGRGKKKALRHRADDL